MLAQINVTVGSKITATNEWTPGKITTDYGVIYAGPLTQLDVSIGTAGYYLMRDEWSGELITSHIWRIETDGPVPTFVRPVAEFPEPKVKQLSRSMRLSQYQRMSDFEY